MIIIITSYNKSAPCHKTSGRAIETKYKPKVPRVPTTNWSRLFHVPVCNVRNTRDVKDFQELASHTFKDPVSKDFPGLEKLNKEMQDFQEPVRTMLNALF